MITRGKWEYNSINGTYQYKLYTDAECIAITNKRIVEDDDIQEVKDNAEFIVSACNACKEINEEHPELVAQNIKDMYEVLKALDSVNSYWWQEVDGDILKRMNKVLSKIKGGE